MNWFESREQELLLRVEELGWPWQPLLAPIQQQLPDARRAHFELLIGKNRLNRVVSLTKYFCCVDSCSLKEAGVCWAWGCAGEEGVVQNEGPQQWLAVNKN